MPEEDLCPRHIGEKKKPSFACGKSTEKNQSLSEETHPVSSSRGRQIYAEQGNKKKREVLRVV
jgi:hypothetical protein